MLRWEEENPVLYPVTEMFHRWNPNIYTFTLLSKQTNRSVIKHKGSVTPAS